MSAKQESVSINRMLELEAELARLRKENGIEAPTPLWVRLGDWLAAHSRQPRRVDRHRYVLLALSCGWLCGAHCFYAGHRWQGLLYLALCWTGFPLAMTLVDVLLAYIKYPMDENGQIEL